MACEVFLVDEKHDLARVRQEELPAGECRVALEMPPATVCLVRLKAK